MSEWSKSVDWGLDQRAAVKWDQSAGESSMEVESAWRRRLSGSEMSSLIASSDGATFFYYIVSLLPSRAVRQSGTNNTLKPE